MIRNRRKVTIDYQQKFGDEQGSRILKDLERLCPLLRGGIDIGKGVDSNRLLVMEGRSDVIKYIYRMMRKDPNEVTQKQATNDIIPQESSV